MQTLKELYKIGPGPSSSHTLAPARACRLYLENYPETESVKVNLYGSLSLTGKGHFT
ncbi:MAG: L-serine ammonia-lyase, partial [Erysipelotrichaceae bacterium]|nr:L-serine ammonia-lyase [Erysipelotrichaceae bacterium]